MKGVAVYLKKSQLEERYNISIGTVNNRVRFIRDRIGKRYPKDAVIDCGRVIRIREDVFHDCMVNMDRIEQGIAPEFEEGDK